MFRAFVAAVLFCAAMAGLSGCRPAEEDGMDVYFVPLDTFRTYCLFYVPGNWGYVYEEWDSQDRITHDTVLIATDVTTQEDRTHLIREEVTQGLGLLADSLQYPDSIFYKDWTNTAVYSDIDRTVIQMLYRDDITPGMTRDGAIEVLRGQYTPQEIDYFLAIAMNLEYGLTDGRIQKWTHAVQVRVHGAPTDIDLETLRNVASDIRQITGTLELVISQ
jgi:hypothetical protein